MDTIGRSVDSIFMLMFITGLGLLGFVSFANVYFGPQVALFTDFAGSAISTCLSINFGQFAAIDQMTKVDPDVAKLWFLLFVVLFSFVLLIT